MLLSSIDDDDLGLDGGLVSSAQDISAPNQALVKMVIPSLSVRDVLE